MRLNFHPSIAFLAVLSIALLAFTGCRSGMPDFAGLKRPDMSKLAFWKSGDGEQIPPPPAHHFDPSPVSEKVAKSKTSDIQEQFNRIAESAKKQKEDLKLGAQTVSAPYSLPDHRAKFSNEPQDLSGAKDSMTTIDATQSENTIAKAQREFNAAIANSKKEIQESVTNSGQSTTELANGWKNDFQLPAKLAAAKTGVDNAQNEFKSSMTKVNNSLYDSAGNLSASVKAKTNQTIRGTLEPNLAAVAASSSSLVENSVSQVQQSANQLQDKGREELESAQAQVKMAQQQIADLKRQIDEARVKSTEAVANAAQQATVMATLVVTKPIDHLAKLSTPAIKYPAAQNNSSKNFSPLDSVSTPSNNFAPSNQLRSNSDFAPVDDKGYSQSNSLKAQPSGKYPATPYGSFAPKEVSRNQTVPTDSKSLGSLAPNFNSSDNFSPDSSRVITADAESAPQAGAQSNVSSASHVADIEIPKKVLTGKSSYAPGSVNPLVPLK